MRIIDVDAHLHEPLDWVEPHKSGTGCRDRVSRRGSWTSPATSSASPTGRSLSCRRPSSRSDRWDLVTPGFVHHLEMTDERQPDDHADDSDDPFYGAAGRLAWCDERGIDVQFLNPTFLVGPFVQVGASSVAST